ncbi:MAG: hypothetical protein DRO43_03190 [Candidatus Hecatellales archaeon]|nr:MAG: hypothetical protein DRO43_03190 [Candidatus Hecatellales archaeon]
MIYGSTLKVGIMNLFDLAKKFAEKNPEYSITVEEEMPGVITDTIMKVEKPKITIYLRPRLGFVTTSPNKDKSFAKRVKGLVEEAAKDGIELHIEPTETRLVVSKVKNFEEAVNSAEKILSFLKKHNLEWGS